MPMFEPLRALLQRLAPADADEFGRAWEKASAQLLPEQRQAVEERLAARIDRERSTPPRIAIIGKSGVGKSSTINALFGTDLPIDHVVPCTQIDEEVAVSGSTILGRAGDIIVHDMPGLGEDIEADEIHKQTYRRVISKCDVAVWIVAATDRAFGFDQMMIRDVVAGTDQELCSRLVIGLNQIDLIQPGHWNAVSNLPSREQAESIERKVTEIRSKFLRVVPQLTEDRIIPYSALRRFRLLLLFEAMLDACATKRRWVLESRRSIADFRELLSAGLRDLLDERDAGHNPIAGRGGP